MPERQSPLAALPIIPDNELLEDDEVVVIVDDYPDIVGLLQEFLAHQGFPTVAAGSAEELRQVLARCNAALVLLDIGLPDADGKTLLPELKANFNDLAVVMLTAVTDLQTALVCLRYGADDYLTKPVQFSDLLPTLRKILEKRRLAIRNRQYQRQIEQANFRIQLAHELAMRMNTAYLTMTELDEILRAILLGITAEAGLQFNRAFLALFDDAGERLVGRLAIGPDSREDGAQIWHDMQESGVSFPDLIAGVHQGSGSGDSEVNRIVQALQVNAKDEDHILIRAVRDRRSINVIDGQSDAPVPLELLGLLEEDTFVVVPLYSPSRALGVLIADHYITREPITAERIHALESFASQASLAIEHCHLYVAMQRKIQELEAVTQELDKNKNLLIEAERYSAIGHMAAQLAHTIRNPITAIGGTARLLARKIDNQEWLQFLDLMTREAEKIEKTLEDLFNFVEQVKPVYRKIQLFQLIHKSILLHFNALQTKHIKRQLNLPDIDPTIEADPKLIQQALVHLIRNSIDAMNSGGVLAVAVELSDETVVIRISDSGSGLQFDQAFRATDPFYTTKLVGTGIGLTMVKRIVEDHGGQLTIRNRSDTSGSEAVVTLPRAPAV